MAPRKEPKIIPVAALSEKVLARYWAKVDKANGPTVHRFLGQCWPWLASTCGQMGYGQFTVAGWPYLAHRVGWAIEHGEDPGDQLVLHHCDNAICQRPAHFYLGDSQANSDDMKERG